jgi:hypothetical protein
VHAYAIPFFEPSSKETIKLIRQLAPTDLDINGGNMLEIYCRTLCADNIRDVSDPPDVHCPSLNKSREALKLFLGPRNIVFPLDPDSKVYSNWVNHHMEGRSFFSTDKGHIGFGPKVANPEDLVVVIPGCDSPMVLRSADNGRYRVVGPCFIYDLSHSEALLGPLPEGYLQIFKTERSQEGFVYNDRNTGKTHTIDPRLYSFQQDVDENGMWTIYVREPDIRTLGKEEGKGIRMQTSNLNIESKDFILMGVDLKSFDLI